MMTSIAEATETLRRALRHALGKDLLISVEAIDSTFGQKQVVVRLTPTGADALQMLVRPVPKRKIQ